MPLFTKRYNPPGTTPGSIIPPAPRPREPMRLRLFEYAEDSLVEKDDPAPEECVRYLEDPRITWIHVQGEPDPDTLREMGAKFDLHPLALEDVANSGQRPKAEVYGHQLFVIAALPLRDDDHFVIRQVSIFLGSNYVVSFCTGAFDPFDPVRRRLRARSGRILGSGTDYLFHALLDVVIDQGFPLLEEFGAQLEDLEHELLTAPTRRTLNHIHAHKRELLLLRKMLWPHREVAAALLRDEHKLFQDSTRVYLRDIQDHAVQILDLLELYREMTTSMLDVYLSSVSNRLNEVMRTLTLIATIFIPLTFVVGLYGMNFDRTSPYNMPELGWTFGYPLIWVIMIAIAAAMVWLFKRRKWL